MITTLCDIEVYEHGRHLVVEVGFHLEVDENPSNLFLMFGGLRYRSCVYSVNQQGYSTVSKYRN